MNFSSDNTSPVPNQILDKIKGANDGHQASYGEDDYMCELTDRIKNIFETEEARVYLVSTGTAANSLALACLSNPWDTIFCSPISHLHQDECNAPEFFTGGAKLTLVGQNDKISPKELNTAMLSEETRGIHGPQRGPVSITQITEKGRCYSLKEIHQISEVKFKLNSQLHMDGARFANALSALNCSPAEMTWMAGVDAVTFGCTKNGLMGVEAVIFFSSKHAREFELRRKRAGHLFSKNIIFDTNSIQKSSKLLTKFINSSFWVVNFEFEPSYSKTEQAAPGSADADAQAGPDPGEVAGDPPSAVFQRMRF